MQQLNEAGIHRSSRALSKLECQDQSTAYFLYQNGGYILFNNPKNIKTYGITLINKLDCESALRTITEASLHKMLSQSNSEVVSHINGPDHGINVDRSHPAPKTIQCTSCSLAKSKKIISRKTGSEIPRSGTPFHTLCWDAIIMDEAYNGDKYISHF